MEIFGYTSALCFIISYLPQIYKTYRRKTIQDMSFSLWALCLFAYITGFIYGCWLGKLPLMLSYGVGGMLNAIILMQWFYYRHSLEARIVMKDRLLDEIERRKR